MKGNHAKIYALATWILTITLNRLFTSIAPLFDSSPDLLPSLVDYRWDVFHFAQLAEHGYHYEYQWAFFPALPAMIRTFPKLSHFIIPPLVAIDSVVALYDLSLQVLGTPTIAYLVTLLSLFPPSPITLRLSLGADSWFTWLSYRGMLHAARSQWLGATFFFTLAATFRSNGIFLTIFILWGLVAEPILQSRKLLLQTLPVAIFYTSLILLPFLYHNYSAFLVFCISGEHSPPSWCDRTIPFIYTYVQAKYWNVGFLWYWTLQQAPNFLIAAPVLVLLSNFSMYHVWHTLFPCPLQRNRNKTSDLLSPFLKFSATPHAIHALAMTSILLTSSHVQIALRLVPSMPIFYWSAAWLIYCSQSPACTENQGGKLLWKCIAKGWVTWSVVWGLLSIALWATFLPPA